jgi:hypothetical protein
VLAAGVPKKLSVRNVADPGSVGAQYAVTGELPSARVTLHTGGLVQLPSAKLSWIVGFAPGEPLPELKVKVNAPSVPVTDVKEAPVPQFPPKENCPVVSCVPVIAKKRLEATVPTT